MIKKLLLMIGVPALSIYLSSLILDSIQIMSFKGLIILSVFLGVLNTTFKPIFKFLTLPVTILSLGLFSFIINGLTLYIAFKLTPDVYITGLGSSILASLIISAINIFLEKILD